MAEPIDDGKVDIAAIRKKRRAIVEASEKPVVINPIPTPKAAPAIGTGSPPVVRPEAPKLKGVPAKTVSAMSVDAKKDDKPEVAPIMPLATSTANLAADYAEALAGNVDPDSVERIKLERKFGLDKPWSTQLVESKKKLSTAYPLSEEVIRPQELEKIEALKPGNKPEDIIKAAREVKSLLDTRKSLMIGVEADAKTVEYRKAMINKFLTEAAASYNETPEQYIQRVNKKLPGQQFENDLMTAIGLPKAMVDMTSPAVVVSELMRPLGDAINVATTGRLTDDPFKDTVNLDVYTDEGRKAQEAAMQKAAFSVASLQPLPVQEYKPTVSMGIYKIPLPGGGMGGTDPNAIKETADGTAVAAAILKEGGKLFDDPEALTRIISQNNEKGNWSKARDEIATGILAKVKAKHPSLSEDDAGKIANKTAYGLLAAARGSGQWQSPIYVTRDSIETGASDGKVLVPNPANDVEVVAVSSNGQIITRQMSYGAALANVLTATTESAAVGTVVTLEKMYDDIGNAQTTFRRELAEGASAMDAAASFARQLQAIDTAGELKTNVESALASQADLVGYAATKAEREQLSTTRGALLVGAALAASVFIPGPSEIAVGVKEATIGEVNLSRQSILNKVASIDPKWVERADATVDAVLKIPGMEYFSLGASKDAIDTLDAGVDNVNRGMDAWNAGDKEAAIKQFAEAEAKSESILRNQSSKVERDFEVTDKEGNVKIEKRLVEAGTGKLIMETVDRTEGEIARIVIESKGGAKTVEAATAAADLYNGEVANALNRLVESVKNKWSMDVNLSNIVRRSSTQSYATRFGVAEDLKALTSFNINEVNTAALQDASRKAILKGIADTEISTALKDFDFNQLLAVPEKDVPQVIYDYLRNNKFDFDANPRSLQDVTSATSALLPRIKREAAMSKLLADPQALVDRAINAVILQREIRTTAASMVSHIARRTGGKQMTVAAAAEAGLRGERNKLTIDEATKVARERVSSRKLGVLDTLMMRYGLKPDETILSDSARSHLDDIQKIAKLPREQAIVQAAIADSLFRTKSQITGRPLDEIWRTRIESISSIDGRGTLEGSGKLAASDLDFIDDDLPPSIEDDDIFIRPPTEFSRATLRAPRKTKKLGGSEGRKINNLFRQLQNDGFSFKEIMADINNVKLDSASRDVMVKKYGVKYADKISAYQKAKADHYYSPITQSFLHLSGVDETALTDWLSLKTTEAADIAKEIIAVTEQTSSSVAVLFNDLIYADMLGEPLPHRELLQKTIASGVWNDLNVQQTEQSDAGPRWGAIHSADLRKSLDVIRNDSSRGIEAKAALGGVYDAAKTPIAKHIARVLYELMPEDTYITHERLQQVEATYGMKFGLPEQTILGAALLTDGRPAHIWLNSDGLMAGIQSPEYVLLHECTHVVTVNAIEQPRTPGEERFRDNISALYNYAKDNYGEDLQLYGLTNEREFIAETLSNREFAEILRKMPYYRRGTIWSNVLSAFYKFFSIEPTSATVLSETLRAFDELLSMRLFDEEKEAILTNAPGRYNEWGFKLFSKETASPVSAKGSVEFNPRTGAAIIEGYARSDASTFLHELAHVIRTELSPNDMDRLVATLKDQYGINVTHDGMGNFVDATNATADSVVTVDEDDVPTTMDQTVIIPKDEPVVPAAEVKPTPSELAMQEVKLYTAKKATALSTPVMPDKLVLANVEVARRVKSNQSSLKAVMDKLDEFKSEMTEFDNEPSLKETAAYKTLKNKIAAAEKRAEELIKERSPILEARVAVTSAKTKYTIARDTAAQKIKAYEARRDGNIKLKAGEKLLTFYEEATTAMNEAMTTRVTLLEAITMWEDAVATEASGLGAEVQTKLSAAAKARLELEEKNKAAAEAKALKESKAAIVKTKEVVTAEVEAPKKVDTVVTEEPKTATPEAVKPEVVQESKVTEEPVVEEPKVTEPEATKPTPVADVPPAPERNPAFEQRLIDQTTTAIMKKKPFAELTDKTDAAIRVRAIVELMRGGSLDTMKESVNYGPIVETLGGTDANAVIATLKDEINSIYGINISGFEHKTKTGKKLFQDDTQVVSKASSNVKPISFKGDLGRLADILTSTLKNQDIVNTVEKELIQNALYATKAKHFAGGYPPGTKGNIKHSVVAAGWNGPYTVTVEEDGIGMSPETVDNAFFTLGGSNQTLLPMNERPGGFGLAKATLLFFADKIELETTKDNVTTKIVASKTQLAALKSGNGTLIPEITYHTTPVPSGTKVSVTIPETLTDEYSGEIIYMQYNMNASAKLLIPPEYANITTNIDDTYINKNDDIRALKEQATALTSGKIGAMQLNISEAELPNVVPEVHIFSNGAYQFSQSLRSYTASFATGARTYFIDIKSNVPPGHPDYPFNPSRTKFGTYAQYGLNPLFSDLAEHSLKHQALFAANVPSASWSTITNNTVVPMETIVSILPAEVKNSSGIPVEIPGAPTLPEFKITPNKDTLFVVDQLPTPFEFKPYKNAVTNEDVTFGQVMSEYGTILQTAIHSTASEIDVKLGEYNAGALLATETGGMHLNPEAIKRKINRTILLNPVNVFGDKAPRTAMAYAMQQSAVLVHELSHFFISYHNEMFTSTEPQVAMAFGETGAEQFQDGMKRFFTQHKPFIDQLTAHYAPIIQARREADYADKKKHADKDLFGTAARSERAIADDVRTADRGVPRPESTGNREAGTGDVASGSVRSNVAEGTGDGNGNLRKSEGIAGVVASRLAETRKSGKLFQSEKTEVVDKRFFRSVLQDALPRVFKDAKQIKAASLLNKLRSVQGLKRNELLFTGLEQKLVELGQKPITLAEAMKIASESYEYSVRIQGGDKAIIPPTAAELNPASQVDAAEFYKFQKVAPILSDINEVSAQLSNMDDTAGAAVPVINLLGQADSFAGFRASFTSLSPQQQLVAELLLFPLQWDKFISLIPAEAKDVKRMFAEMPMPWNEGYTHSVQMFNFTGSADIVDYFTQIDAAATEEEANAVARQIRETFPKEKLTYKKELQQFFAENPDNVVTKAFDTDSLRELFETIQAASPAEKPVMLRKLLADYQVVAPVASYSRFMLPGSDEVNLLLDLDNNPAKEGIALPLPTDAQLAQAEALANTPQGQALMNTQDAAAMVPMHFGKENLAHARGNTQIINGKKYFFLQEIQSDVMQAIARGKVQTPTRLSHPETSDWTQAMLRATIKYAVETGHEGIILPDASVIMPYNLSLPKNLVGDKKELAKMPKYVGAATYYDTIVAPIIISELGRKNDVVPVELQPPNYARTDKNSFVYNGRQLAPIVLNDVTIQNAQNALQETPVDTATASMLAQKYYNVVRDYLHATWPSALSENHVAQLDKYKNMLNTQNQSRLAAHEQAMLSSAKFVQLRAEDILNRTEQNIRKHPAARAYESLAKKITFLEEKDYAVIFPGELAALPAEEQNSWIQQMIAMAAKENISIEAEFAAFFAPLPPGESSAVTVENYHDLLETVEFKRNLLRKEGEQIGLSAEDSYNFYYTVGKLNKLGLPGLDASLPDSELLRKDVEQTKNFIQTLNATRDVIANAEQAAEKLDAAAAPKIKLQAIDFTPEIKSKYAKPQPLFQPEVDSSKPGIKITIDDSKYSEEVRRAEEAWAEVIESVFKNKELPEDAPPIFGQVADVVRQYVTDTAQTIDGMVDASAVKRSNKLMQDDDATRMPRFKSVLVDAVNAAFTNKNELVAGTLLNQLRKAGVTGNEFRFTGVEKFLTERGQKKVTKAEIEPMLESSKNASVDFESRWADIMLPGKEAVELLVRIPGQKTGADAKQHYTKTPVVHIRGNGHVIEGKKYFFIQEIQSDAAQGLRDSKRPEKYTLAQPDTSSWTRTAIRAALQHAALNNYDGIILPQADVIMPYNLDLPVTSIGNVDKIKQILTSHDLELDAQQAEGRMPLLPIYEGASTYYAQYVPNSVKKEIAATPQVKQLIASALPAGHEAKIAAAASDVKRAQNYMTIREEQVQRVLKNKETVSAETNIVPLADMYGVKTNRSWTNLVPQNMPLAALGTNVVNAWQTAVKELQSLPLDNYGDYARYILARIEYRADSRTDVTSILRFFEEDRTTIHQDVDNYNRPGFYSAHIRALRLADEARQLFLGALGQQPAVMEPMRKAVLAVLDKELTIEQAKLTEAKERVSVKEADLAALQSVKAEGLNITVQTIDFTPETRAKFSQPQKLYQEKKLTASAPTGTNDIFQQFMDQFDPATASPGPFGRTNIKTVASAEDTTSLFTDVDLSDPLQAEKDMKSRLSDIRQALVSLEGQEPPDLLQEQELLKKRLAAIKQTPEYKRILVAQLRKDIQAERDRYGDNITPAANKRINQWNKKIAYLEDELLGEEGKPSTVLPDDMEALNITPKEVAKTVPEQKLTDKIYQQLTTSPLMRNATGFVLGIGADENWSKRAIPPEARKIMMTAIRPIQETISDISRLITEGSENLAANKQTLIEAADTGDAKAAAVFDYLNGKQTKFGAGGSTATAGINHVEWAYARINAKWHALDDMEKNVLQAYADACGFDENGNVKTYVSGLSTADANRAAGLINGLLATAESADSKPDAANPGDLFLGMAKQSVWTSNNAEDVPKQHAWLLSLFAASDAIERPEGVMANADPAKRLVSALSYNVSSNIEAPHHAAVWLATHGSLQQSRHALLSQAFGVSREDAVSFEKWKRGQFDSEADFNKIDAMARRYGLTATFELAPELGISDIMVPSKVRAEIRNELLHGRKLLSAEEKLALQFGADTQKVLSGEYKVDFLSKTMGNLVMGIRKMRVLGAFFNRPQGYTNDMHGILDAASSNSGFKVGIAATLQRSLQLAITNTPLLSDALDALGMLARFSGSDNRVARVQTQIRRALSNAGDTVSKALITAASASRSYPLVTEIIDGAPDKFIEVGDKKYSHFELRQIWLQEGVFATFERGQTNEALFNEVSPKGGQSAAKWLRAKANIPSRYRYEQSNEAGTYVRVGLATTYLRLGYDPRTAGRAAVGTAHDYVNSTTGWDKSLWYNVFFPFQAFRKNNARFITDRMTTYDSIRKLAKAHRLYTQIPDVVAAISAIEQQEEGNEYGIMATDLSPDARDELERMRLIIEEGFSPLFGEDANRWPDDVKRGLAEGQDFDTYWNGLDPKAKNLLVYGYQGYHNVPLEVKQSINMLYSGMTRVVSEGSSDLLERRRLDLNEDIYAAKSGIKADPSTYEDPRRYLYDYQRARNSGTIFNPSGPNVNAMRDAATQHGRRVVGSSGVDSRTATVFSLAETSFASQMNWLGAMMAGSVFTYRIAETGARTVFEATDEDLARWKANPNGTFDATDIEPDFTSPYYSFGQFMDVNSPLLIQITDPERAALVGDIVKAAKGEERSISLHPVMGEFLSATPGGFGVVTDTSGQTPKYYMTPEGSFVLATTFRTFPFELNAMLQRNDAIVDAFRDAPTKQSTAAMKDAWARGDYADPTTFMYLLRSAGFSVTDQTPSSVAASIQPRWTEQSTTPKAE